MSMSTQPAKLSFLAKISQKVLTVLVIFASVFSTTGIVLAAPLAASPVNLAVGTVTTQTVTVTWEPGGGGENTFILHQQGPNDPQFVQVSTLPVTGAASYSYTYLNLTPDTDYTFKVVAAEMDGQNNMISGSAALTPVVHTPVPTPAPAGPTNVVVDTIKFTSANITWQPGVGGNEAEYLVRLSTDGQLFSTASTVLAVANQTSYLAALTNLVDGKQYSVAVVATDINGNLATSAASAVVQFSTPVIPDSIMYEDGTSGTASAWFTDPPGTNASIANVITADPAHGQVIAFTGDPNRLDSRMVFYAPDTNPWQLSALPILQWDMKYAGESRVLIYLDTSDGVRYLSYGTDTQPGVGGNKFYFQLDPSFQDGNWHTLTRDLQKDVHVYAPTTTVYNVAYFSYFAMAGTGQVDNVQLLKTATPTATLSGVVKDNLGNVVAGVKVSAPPYSLSTVTDAQGAYVLPGLPAGNYTLTFAKFPYVFATSNFAVDAQGTDVVQNGVGTIPPFVMYEDGSSGNTANWFITPAGTNSVLENVTDDQSHGPVVSLTTNPDSIWTRMVFYAPAGNPWLFPTYPILQWDMKYAGDFQVLIYLDTSDGVRYLSYSTTQDPGFVGNKFYFRMDDSFKDGNWHTITRDLQKDVNVYSPTTIIQGIGYFSIYGNGKVDNLRGLRNLPPVAPTSVTVNNATATTADVSWTPGVGGGEVMYKFLAATNGGAYADAAPAQVTAPATTATVTNLAPNTSYTFEVVASNGAAVDDKTSTASGAILTLASVPRAPLVTRPTATTLDVAVDNTDGNPANTTYSIQETNSGKFIQADASLGTTEVFVTAAAWGVKTVTGLSASTAYLFVAKAKNADGFTTAVSPATTGTTSATPVVVVPPATQNTGGGNNQQGGTNYYAGGSSSGGGGGGSSSSGSTQPSNSTVGGSTGSTVGGSTGTSESSPSAPAENTTPVTGQILGIKVIRIEELIALTHYGEHSNNVGELQQELKKIGLFPKGLRITKYYGPITKRGVEQYQANQLTLDELVAQTRFGLRGAKVRRLQTELRKLKFFPARVRSTGYFGPITKGAVSRYQAQQ